MIKDAPHKFLPESIDELPDLAGAEIIYLDFETTSGDNKKNSKNPWLTCDVLGICITVDDDPNAYYVPLRHRQAEKNLPIEPVYEWLREIVRKAKVWINSNVKYDVHVLLNYVGNISVRHLELKDTVTLAKIVNSDLFVYGLKELSRDWLRHDISAFEQENKIYTHNPGGSIKIHDYAAIHWKEMYLYGTQDVLSARSLYKYIMEEIPEDCLDIVETENKLTSVLVEIEQTGMYVDKELIGRDAIKRIPRILERLEDELLAIVGKYFRPHVNRDCFDILCTEYGAPVISYTPGGKKKKAEPSFDKHTLKIYKTYSEIPEGVVEKIIEYRHFHQLLGTFTKPYLFKSKKRRMHGSFNQSVRTGRMSMSDPNMQQSSPDAKKYIIPTPGYYLADYDLSQIEYRYVATYTENPAILAKYRESKDADYHQIMADLCGIERAPAKNMNFAVSFRAGKKKTIAMLRGAFKPEDVPEGMTFDHFMDLKGNEVFDLYHARHPELRIEWNAAQLACKRRGYARNIWGRRRHIQGKGSYMAFPNIIQSSAADLMKRITIRLQNLVQDKGPRLICIVHDSWLFEIPIGEEHWENRIKDCIEATESRLTVPLYASMKKSNKNWSECE